MRYLDSGSRDPEQTLGHWLGVNLRDDGSVTALRWQSGFFGADVLGYFAPLLAHLSDVDGGLSVLIGSNDGTTSRADVAAVLASAGPPRPNRRIGVVRFSNAFFHPKTVHIERSDGSQAAYVGSANLTRSGATSLHVEAGIIVDSSMNDEITEIERIASAVDWWFQGERDGLNIVSTVGDLDPLVGSVLSVAAPKVSRPTTKGKTAASSAAKLVPLVGVPALPPEVAAALATKHEAASPDEVEVAEEAEDIHVQMSETEATEVIWSKTLTVSDAQRKASGNQRGSITLVQAGHDIDAQTYFRTDLFGGVEWHDEQTRTHEVRQVAAVEFDVTILGDHVGRLEIPISYAPNREAAQANYTTLLHLGPLSEYFAEHDMSGRQLALGRDAGGNYTLEIAEDES